MASVESVRPSTNPARFQAVPPDPAAESQADPAFLRALLASSGDCMKILDLSGRVIFMSDSGRDLMAVEDFATIQHCVWSSFWSGPHTLTAQAAVRMAGSGQHFRFTGPATTMKGELRWWDVDVSPILGPHGRPERLLVVSRDVTDRKSAERRQSALIELGDTLRNLAEPAQITAAAAAILGSGLLASRAAYAEVAAGGDLVIGHTWTGHGIAGAQGCVRRVDFPAAFERLARGEVVAAADVVATRGTHSPGFAAAIGAEASATIRALMAVPLLLDGRLRGVMLVHDEAVRAWDPMECEFARGVADRCAAALAKAEAETHQQFLNAELSHRMKNILAMAQAIALQTMRVSTDVATATEVLSGRLSALGKAHDILLGGGHSGGNVRSIVQGALRMHDDRRPDRFHLSGPQVAVGHRAGLPLALIVHELATNAAKYGALSTPGGAVDIAWSEQHGNGEPSLALTWTERGGPPVVAPARRGFGTRLIERGLSGQVGGITTLAYEPDGLVCTITVALAGLQAQD
jgi:PAS domain S-box-containing protein